MAMMTCTWLPSEAVYIHSVRFGMCALIGQSYLVVGYLWFKEKWVRFWPTWRPFM